MLDGDERGFTSRSPIVEETRIDTQLAWGEGHFIDPNAKREACGRLCIARNGGIQALISFDFWLSDSSVCEAHWLKILSSLQLARWVEDPRRGPSYS